MKLYIQECEDLHDIEEGIFVMPVSYVAAAGAHLFIASHKWDEIYIEYSPNIKAEYVTNFNAVSSSIRVKVPSELTKELLDVLIILYPESAPALRRCYMTGGDVKGVLPQCLVH